MTMHFRPSIRRNGTLYELPRPIVSVRINDTWDIERYKIPLLQGDTFVGHSRSGVDIALEGQIGSQAGQITLDEPTMFAALEQLRTALNVADETDRFELVLYQDDDSDFRSFRECSSLRFEYDLSNARLFTYSVVIHASDPSIHAGVV